MEKNSKEIMILTGAGLSNLFGLPMTEGFTSLINESSRFGLNDLLASYLGNGMSDIEKVMFVLEDCLDKESCNLQRHILETGKYFPQIRADNGAGTASRDSVNQQIKHTYQEIKENAKKYLLFLKGGIYDLLADFDKEKASNLYYRILAQIKAKYPDAKISIFTTNYDLSFERSCHLKKDLFKTIGIDTDAIEYGFLRSNIPMFNNTPNSERNYLEYYKLHGSLDWHYDEDYGCTKAGANAKPAHPETMPILYPGIKGKPIKEPFTILHDIFYNRLQTVDKLIVIGFAFRDPYINELIKFSKIANKKYQMVFFNPIDITKLPKESGIHEFKNIFKNDLQYAQIKIEIEDDPFKQYL